MSRPHLALLSLCVVACATVSPGWAQESAPIFEADIRPLFVAKCGKCHSDSVRKADLDLSTIEGLHRGGESGESLVTAEVEENWLWSVIAEAEMPPEGETPLSDQERELIRSWIVGGAQAEQPRQPSTRQLTQHDVLPILLLRCTVCHGPRLQEAGLDLRSPLAMRKGGRSGPALVPGDPDASLIIRRIESEACPPQEKLLKFFVRRPANAEVELLRDWIRAGAPVTDVAPDVATTEPDPLVTGEDRGHWAFQPPQSPSEPASIDNLIEAKLRDHGLDLSPEADRDMLIRRAYIDLLGMPPSLADWNRWRHSAEPGWYSQMIEHLLASPHYGERWGRYWLDLAGYADSEGGVSADPLREVAWKYRDYVIDAFNEDKPYDRFLLEQIAGDELLDCEQADVVSEEMVDNLIATGFLRMGIDQTGSRTMNFVPERLGVIGDVITVVGSGLMGLTLECARCHSHKYDAIPHRDYYRFKAIFQGALDEHDWLSFKTRSLNIATPEHRSLVSRVNPPFEAELKSLRSRLRAAGDDVRMQLLRYHYPEQSETDRRETLVALKKADNTRTLTQRLLVEKLQRVELLPEADQPESVREAQREVASLEDQIEQVRRQMVPPIGIRALWDRGQPSPTYILRRGEHNKPGDLVGPGVPSVLTDGKTPFEVQPPFPDGTPKTGRRLAFARWLTDPAHPLTSRVMVNRIWYHHFGQGLVQSLENFGVQGERPSHPELLDWLAVRFVEEGWSIKSMHRIVMNSRAYRQSSRITEDRLERDPTGRLLSRMPLRRMNAEALRDSLLFVAGVLDESPGGPPDPVTVNRDGLVSVLPTPGDGRRRSVYLQYRRTEIPTLMETFDYPEMGPNCFARNVSTVAPQSLMLMNNAHVHELSRAFATRIESIAEAEGWDDHDFGPVVDAVYAMALSRQPSDEERVLGTRAIRELRSGWQGDSTAALASYCHTILNSAAFLYVD